MSVFIALARGINVGGKHKLAMKPLAALFEAAGARDVRTYIQSGNVIFTATGNSAARLVAQVSSAIAAEHGFAVPIVWRTASQWQALTLDPPFVPDQADASLVHVAFFAAQPVAERVRSLDVQRFLPDRFELRGRELFIHYPGGSARSKLNVAYLERQLAVGVTQRNWRTVLELARLAKEQAKE